MKKKNEKDFPFLELLPPEDRAFCEEKGINSIEDLFLAVINDGIDPIKLTKVIFENDGKSLDEYVKEDFAIDEKGSVDELRHLLMKNKDKYDDEYDDEYNDENYYEDFPQGLLLDGESKEYHIRIKLNDSPVDVWRELYVPSNISLELLAQVLVYAMGWNDSHLHQFIKNNILYKNTEELIDEEFFPFPTRSRDANEVALGHLLQKKGDRMKFEYDFGDSWMHDIWVKGVREYEVGEQPRVKLLKGKGCCPPDDCGGVWGYSDLLFILNKKRKTAEEKERLKWAGIDKYFNPEFYDKEDYGLFLEEYWDSVLDEIEYRKH